MISMTYVYSKNAGLNIVHHTSQSFGERGTNIVHHTSQSFGVKELLLC
jgi:hypothetical protein